VIEDKAVRPERVTGEVLRLGSRRVEARLDRHLAPMTNLRLRLHYPALARDSADLYGKVLAAREEGGAWVATVGLTSVDAADEQVLETFLRVRGSDRG
jgi:hypothetical protein